MKKRTKENGRNLAPQPRSAQKDLFLAERAKNLSKTFFALHCFFDQMSKEAQPSS